MAFVNAILIGLAALFLSIPILNQSVFKSINIEEVMLRGYDGITAVQQLLKEQKFEECRDSARAYIQRFRNDSAEFFVGDVSDWLLFQEAVQDTSSPDIQALRVRFDPGYIDSLSRLRDIEMLDYGAKKRVIDFLNELVADSLFYIQRSDGYALKPNSEAGEVAAELEKRGVLVRKGDSVTLGTLDTADRRLLRYFHVRLLADYDYSRWLQKNMRRGSDWASEYVVQTMMYLIGSTYSAQFMLDKAISVLDSLILIYPGTIYAEQIFLSNGQSLLAEGKNNLATGKTASAKESFRQAIYYFSKIEKNRPIAKSFPKYKYADLNPEQYVNMDAASKAKGRIKERGTVYTQDMAKEDLAGRDEAEQSGYVLEDAVRLIGECYVLLGETDSARAQFSLILDYFPESENIDDAQKLIADSYIKDGEMILAAADSGDAEARAEANERFALAIKEYQKFINVYPQSDLISQTYIDMGDAYYKMNRSEDAVKAFAAALARAKNSEEQAKTQLKIGSYYYERGQYVEAIDAFNVILNNFSSSQVASNAQYLIGECHDKMGDTTAAIDAYTVIVTHYKQSQYFGGAAFKIGNFYFNSGNYKEALKLYKTGIAYDPQGSLAPKTQFQIGVVWQKIAESQEGEQKESTLKEAIKEFRVVVDRAPNTNEADQALFQIAKSYVELGNIKAAREATNGIQRRDIRLSGIKLFPVEAANDSADLKYWIDALQAAIEDEERATASYEIAMVQLDKIKNYSEAMKSFHAALGFTEDPIKQINARIGIARSHSAMGRHEAAADTLEMLVADPKASAELRQQLQIQLYDALLKKGDTRKAFEGFERFTVQFPEHVMAPYAFYRMGTILADQEKYREAIEKLSIITGKYPDSDMLDKAALTIGTQMIALERYREAVEYLDDFIEDHPEAPVAAHIYLKIAETWWKHLDNTGNARQAFAHAVETYPDDNLHSYIAYQYGLLLRELNDEQAAIEAFNEVKESDKAIFRAAQAEIGKILTKSDPEAAIENYRLIVDKSETPEDSVIALMGIGDVYAAIKKYEEAAEAFQEVYAFYRNGKDTTLLAGAIVKWVDALINSKQNQKAIETARIMQERFPDNSFTINTIYYEATAYFSLGAYARARERFEKIIELDQSEALTEIAYYQKADTWYFTAPRVSEEDAERRERVYRTAINEYEQYLKNYPDGRYAARALYMQGNGYWTLQDYERAKAKFAAVLQKYPDFDERCNAKNLLAYSMNKLDQWKQARSLYYEVVRGGCDAKTTTFANEQIELITGQH